MHPYHLADIANIPTPALVFYPEFIRQNVARVVKIAGGTERLRPHAKTHKTREITKLQLAAGVNKHKCATIAEAELLAECGVPDVLIAYQLVGPNVHRLGVLARKFPETTFSVLVDHLAGVDGVAAAARESKRGINAFVDLDVGQHRTGIAIGEEAAALYERITSTPGVKAAGLHVYDGHNHQVERSDRDAAARAALEPALQFRALLQSRGLPVERVVVGGTPMFPVYATMKDVPGLECSPGTYVLHDHTYNSKYQDLSGITPAAVLITRVISRPTADRVTFDLGTKSVAADPLMTNRVHLLELPNAKSVGHNEEHLIVETPEAGKFKPGDVCYALPGHVCPSVALHREALTAEGGRITGRWTIVARDRVLTV